ncbi:uncharacterized protein [Antedon mediterranea]|uniref:uncharacterized protein n=1 Tax=Antedon mediterranea TaxID=105859 RepID=UPI003AF424D8
MVRMITPQLHWPQKKSETAKLDADEAREEIKRQETGTESKAVYISPGRRLEVFQGRPKKATEPIVEDWVADVPAQLDMRRLSPGAAVAFIKENLGGYPRKEISGRGKEVENNPNQVLEILLKVFGYANNLPQLQQKFFTYKQCAQQDLLSLSLELVSLYDSIVILDGAYKPCREASLKSRLAEAVSDHNLQRELRHLNIESPRLSFFQLRDRAVAWLGDVGRNPTEAAVRTVSAKTKILDLLQKQNVQLEMQQRQINMLHRTVCATSQLATTSSNYTTTSSTSTNSRQQMATTPKVSTLLFHMW